jgi:hypothetical protein
MHLDPPSLSTTSGSPIDSSSSNGRDTFRPVCQMVDACLVVLHEEIMTRVDLDRSRIGMQPWCTRIRVEYGCQNMIE